MTATELVEGAATAPAKPAERGFIHRYGTPLTLGLFVISTVSGLALFFHWQQRIFHGMHEWLSILLLVPFGLHFWKNWRPLLVYARRGWLVWPLLACLAAAIPFAAGSLMGGPGGPGGRGGNPGFRAVGLLTQTPLTALAPVLKTTPEALQAALKARGYSVVSTGDTLEAVARASGKPAPELLFGVMP